MLGCMLQGARGDYDSHPAIPACIRAGVGIWITLRSATNLVTLCPKKVTEKSQFCLLFLCHSGTWECFYAINSPVQLLDLTVPNLSKISFYRKTGRKGMQKDTGVTSHQTQRVGLIPPIFGCFNAMFLLYSAAVICSFHSQWREMRISEEKLIPSSYKGVRQVNLHREVFHKQEISQMTSAN